MADVNGSEFHLLAGPADWAPFTGPGAALRYDRGREGVTLAPELFRFPARQGGTSPDLSARRGAAVDAFGNLFAIGADEASIDIHPAGLREHGRYWPPAADAAPAPEPTDPAAFRPCPPPEAPVPLRLRGLTVTSLNYLVAGTLDPAGLLVLDLHGGGPAERVFWPEDVPFSPFDLFPARDGGVWILDRDGADGATRWWRLDRRMRPVAGGVSGPDLELAPEETELFHPVGGAPRVLPAATFPAGRPLPVAPGFDARAIVGLTDETVLVLGRAAGEGVSTILRLDRGLLLDAVPLAGAALDGLLPGLDGIAGFDMAFHRGETEADGTLTGLLRVIAADGDQAFEFDLRAAAVAEGGALSLRLRPSYLPVRAFAGKGLVEACEDTLYDLPERWIPLTAQPRRRYAGAGTAEAIRLDAGLPDTLWRRIDLDACIPEGAGIEVELRTAAEEEDLDLAEWRPQPRPHLRGDGADLPFHDPFPDHPADARGAGVWEFLVQAPRGRWLELRVTLTGDGRASPLLRRLRAWRPGFSYLDRYLPAIYREEPAPADFLDRWLANVEGLFTAMEGRVAEAERFFDPRTAPDEALDWLGDWLGAETGRLSDPRRKRLLIANAHLLWDWRGTPLGLLTLLRLALDECVDETLFDPLRTGVAPCPAEGGLGLPRLVEGFLARDYAPAAVGDPGAQGPALVRADAPYDASRGAGPLHAAWRAWLGATYGEGAAGDAALAAAWGRDPGPVATQGFPAQTPAAGPEQADWIAAGRGAFGFLYPEVGAADAAAWTEFLTRRHRTPARLNAAWGLVGAQQVARIADIGLPTALPTVRGRLTDWLDFVSRMLPIRRAAHRFSVLLPAAPGDSPADMARRADAAAAIVARERPAHAAFDVRFFWSLFQVGAARLGADTVVGEGARFAAVVLGRTALGAGYLSHSHPWSVRSRMVVGRDAAKEA